MRPDVPGAIVDLHFRRVGRQSSVFPAPPDTTTTDKYIYIAARGGAGSNYICRYRYFTLAPV